MLILLGYDISDHKRLAKVAKTCEDYGLRVHFNNLHSLFTLDARPRLS
jgi:CRISPR-associated endonuclease Cas2